MHYRWSQKSPKSAKRPPTTIRDMRVAPRISWNFRKSAKRVSQNLLKFPKRGKKSLVESPKISEKGKKSPRIWQNYNFVPHMCVRACLCLRFHSCCRQLRLIFGSFITAIPRLFFDSYYVYQHLQVLIIIIINSILFSTYTFCL